MLKVCNSYMQHLDNKYDIKILTIYSGFSGAQGRHSFRKNIVPEIIRCMLLDI